MSETSGIREVKPPDLGQLPDDGRPTEQQYRALIESMGEGAAHLASDGTILYCNASLGRILERPLESIIGTKLSVYVGTQHKGRFEASQETGQLECRDEEISLISSSGRAVDLVFSCSPIDTAAGLILGLVFADVSEIKGLERKAAQLSQLYATLSAVNQAIVCTSDQANLFRECCRAAVEQGGFHLAWIGAIEDETQLVRNIESYGETGYLEGIRITVKNEPEGLGPTGLAVRDGSYHVCNNFLEADYTKPWHEQARAHGIRSSASIVLKQGGARFGALTLYSDKKNFFDAEHVALLLEIGEDISLGLDLLRDRQLRMAAERALRTEALAHERTQAALRDKEQALIDQNRQAEMGAMIGNISHQWRQPLNVLGITIQKLLILHDLGKLSREILQTSVKESMDLIMHMSDTISDFMDFFKPNREKMKFSAWKSVTDVLSLIKASLDEAGIVASVEVIEDTVLFGHPNEFSQALLNIILNAKDALLERKTPEPRIDISLRKSGERALISISDNAGGIPGEVLSKLFTPYFTTKGPGGGTGIGLTMSKAIVERNMGGSLSVRNSEKGAEFLIELMSP